MKKLILLLIVGITLIGCSSEPVNDCDTITAYELVIGEGTPVEDYYIIVLDYKKRYTIPVKNYNNYPKPHLGVSICIDEKDATSRQ